jgi:hypothetical protein
MSPTQKNFSHPEESARIRALFLFFMVTVAVLGLIFIWKQLPIPSRSLPMTTATSTDGLPGTALTKASCESGGGHWNECGSACRGSDGPCIQVCVPQCECGGIAGFSCPKNFICSDYLPSEDTPDAMGICKTVSSPVVVQAKPFVAPRGMTCGAEGVICISNSIKGRVLSNPFFVTGTVSEAFGLTWLMTSDTVAHPVYASGKVVVSAEPVDGRYPFEISGLLPPLPSSALFTVEREIATTDEEMKYIYVTVPVTLPRGESTTKYAIPENLQTYFLQDMKSLQDEDLLAKQPMRIVSEKIATTQTPIAASLAALVEWAMKERIVPGTWPYYKVELKNGVACVHNDAATDAGMGKTLLIKETKWQFDPLVKATLKQFPSVKSIECL